ncbi:MAG: STY0301 family protein [Burkholderiaceae bacterium]|jgi:hypothetical protein
MSSNEWIRRAACIAACFVATACAGADRAPAPAGVCPVHAGTGVSQIDLFDGDPAEQVLLAPDDDQAGANTYSVKTVYDAHRVLTIRCHYGAASEDVKLVKPVSVCRYSGGEAHPTLTCK